MLPKVAKASGDVYLSLALSPTNVANINAPYAGLKAGTCESS
jgi:hypothetical protein